MEKLHTLKLHKDFFTAVITGRKTFEVRFNDRKYKLGDIVVFTEWTGEDYTGRVSQLFVIRFILSGMILGLREDFVAFSIYPYNKHIT